MTSNKIYQYHVSHDNWTLRGKNNFSDIIPPKYISFVLPLENIRETQAEEYFIK